MFIIAAECTECDEGSNDEQVDAFIVCRYCAARVITNGLFSTNLAQQLSGGVQCLVVAVFIFVFKHLSSVRQKFSFPHSANVVETQSHV